MHFKSALIICAVYFLTPAQSIEMNGNQLGQLNEVFENQKGISGEEIVHVVKSIFGVEWKNLKIRIKYDSNDFSYTNLVYLLKSLAASDNERFDRSKVNILMPDDIGIFLDEFIEHAIATGQQGIIYIKQLSEVFKHWKTVHRALEAKIVELEGKKNDDYVINAAGFLLIMMEIKPEGYGLTLAQIEKFGSLCKPHMTPPNSIDPTESEKLFNELCINIDNELEDLFKSGRPAEMMLIDLMVAAVERNKAVDENQRIVLSPTEFVFFTHQFNVFDRNHDGVMSVEEYSLLTNLMLAVLNEEQPEAVKKAQLYLKNFDDLKTINVAVYMAIVMFFRKCIFEESAI